MKREPHGGVELVDSSEINTSDYISQSNGGWIVWQKLGEAIWSWWLLVNQSLIDSSWVIG